MEEELGLLLESVGVFGGEVVGLGVFGTALLNLRMALQVAFQALGYVFALGDDADTGREVFEYLRHEQGIMGAAEDQGIDLRIKAHDLVVALLDEIVGAWGVGLVVFDEGHPEGTGDA